MSLRIFFKSVVKSPPFLGYESLRTVGPRYVSLRCSTCDATCARRAVLPARTHRCYSTTDSLPYGVLVTDPLGNLLNAKNCLPKRKCRSSFMYGFMRVQWLAWRLVSVKGLRNARGRALAVTVLNPSRVELDFGEGRGIFCNRASFHL